MKRQLVILSALLLCLVLSACASSPPTQQEGRCLNYNLGEGTLQTSLGKSVPYQMQGVLGIPDGQNCPIVVLVHGSHPITVASEDRYDIGFNYLVEQLSEAGNLVISLNVGMNYSFEAGEPIGNERTRQIFAQQMTLLQEAVAGNAKLFGRDLTGVGDFDKVVLMGHSRGGLDVLELASEPPVGIGVAGVVSVAPALYKVLETDLPNVPIGILLPQMDGDVISLDGNDIYEYLLRDPAYTEDADLIYLKSANHGAFNTQLTQPDLNHTGTEHLLPPQQQRAFLADYLTDFVSCATNDGRSVFAANDVLCSRAYGCDILLRVYNGAGQTLYSAEGDAAPECGPGTSIARQIASFLPAENTLQLFRMPGGAAFEHYALEEISWADFSGEVTFPTAASCSGYAFLDLDMAIDSTDVRNQKGQALLLTVSDRAGNTASVSLSAAEAALSWQDGELLEEMGWDDQLHQIYSTLTPLATLRIPLRQLSGIDQSAVWTIRLSWPESSGGSLMLRSIRCT